jgi:hypothetical protein
MKKATDEQLLEEYKKTGSVWSTAAKFGMCGQSVHERMVKLNAIPQWKWTKEEDELLIQFYDRAGENKTFLNEAEAILKRHKTNICRRARKFNLTNIHRKPEEILVSSLAERAKEWRIKNGHPKGMLGKKHTNEAKKKIAEKNKQQAQQMSQEQWDKRTLKNNATRIINGTHKEKIENAFSRTKSGKRVDLGGQFFRSKTEANFARFLNAINMLWEYESKTFYFDGIKRGCLSYTPDFYCVTENRWFEVKGWMDVPSITRLKRFKKYHPEEANKLIIVSQSKKTYTQAIGLGYDVIRYENIEKEYRGLECWEY